MFSSPLSFLLLLCSLIPLCSCQLDGTASRVVLSTPVYNCNGGDPPAEPACTDALFDNSLTSSCTFDTGSNKFCDFSWTGLAGMVFAGVRYRGLADGGGAACSEVTISYTPEGGAAIQLDKRRCDSNSWIELPLFPPVAISGLSLRHRNKQGGTRTLTLPELEVYQPTQAPTPAPTDAPTPPPTTTPPPTQAPTLQPTAAPTPQPTPSPSPSPTVVPTAGPTQAPSPSPTVAPTTQPPTVAPTAMPTSLPTPAPPTLVTPQPTAGSTPGPSTGEVQEEVEVEVGSGGQQDGEGEGEGEGYPEDDSGGDGTSGNPPVEPGTSQDAAAAAASNDDSAGSSSSLPMIVGIVVGIYCCASYLLMFVGFKRGWISISSLEDEEVAGGHRRGSGREDFDMDAEGSGPSGSGSGSNATYADFSGISAMPSPPPSKPASDAVVYETLPPASSNAGSAATVTYSSLGVELANDKGKATDYMELDQVHDAPKDGAKSDEGLQRNTSSRRGKKKGSAKLKGDNGRPLPSPRVDPGDSSFRMATMSRPKPSVAAPPPETSTHAEPPPATAVVVPTLGLPGPGDKSKRRKKKKEGGKTPRGKTPRGKTPRGHGKAAAANGGVQDSAVDDDPLADLEGTMAELDNMLDDF